MFKKGLLISVSLEILLFLRDMVAKLTVPALKAGTSIVNSCQDKTSGLSRPELAIDLKLIRAPTFYWDPIGLSDLFGDAVKYICRFNDSSGNWLVYDTRAWCEDNNKVLVEGYVKEMALQLKQLYPQIVQDIDDDQKEIIWKIIFGKMTQRKFRTDLIADSRDHLRITASYLSGKYLSGKFPCESEDDAVRQKYGNVSVCVICDEHRNKCRKCAYKNERVNLFPCEMCEKEKYCGGIRFAKARPDRRLTCFRMLEG